MFQKFMNAAALVIGLAVSPAVASDYPNKPITVIVPYAAGGPSDTAIRIISDRFSQALGQPVLIENVAGAGGMLGATKAARSAPDGYTLLLHQNGLVIGPWLSPTQTIDVEKELTAVGMVNGSYMFLVGNEKIPAKNAKELVAWMKGPGSPAKFAHPGVGSLAHLQAILFAKGVGADVSLVGYRGGGQAMNDIIGGHADLVWAASSTAADLINTKKVKGFGFGSPKRYPELGEIATFEESGVPGMGNRLWQGLFVPAGTPKPVIEKLNAALRETLADEKVKATYKKLGVEAFPAEEMSPEAANKLVSSELKKWGGVIKDANIKPEGK